MFCEVSQSPSAPRFTVVLISKEEYEAQFLFIFYFLFFLFQFSIAEIITVTPLYMVISGLLNYTDSIGDTVFYRNASWNPRLSQKGRHIFCFKAVDNFGWVTSTKLLKSPSLSFKEGTNAYLQTTQGLSHFSYVSWITAQ